MRSEVQERTFQRRLGHTTTVMIGHEQLWLAAGQHPDGTLAAVAMGWGKHGSSGAGLLESYALALSVGVQHGVPLADLLRPGLGLRFAPDGRTDDPEIPDAYSAVDYWCRRLAIDWLPYSDRAGLGVFTAAELGRQAARVTYADRVLAPARGPHPPRPRDPAARGLSRYDVSRDVWSALPCAPRGSALARRAAAWSRSWAVAMSVTRSQPRS